MKMAQDLPAFVEVQLREFESYDDVMEWALSYMRMNREVNLCYLKANVRTRALVEYNARVLAKVNMGLQSVIARFGMNARLRELEIFMQKMRKEILLPLEAIPLTE